MCPKIQLSGQIAGGAILGCNLYPQGVNFRLPKLNFAWLQKTVDQPPQPYDDAWWIKHKNGKYKMKIEPIISNN